MGFDVSNKIFSRFNMNKLKKGNGYDVFIFIQLKNKFSGCSFTKCCKYIYLILIENITL